jgi:predicted nucleotidyltransferase
MNSRLTVAGRKSSPVPGLPMEKLEFEVVQKRKKLLTEELQKIVSVLIENYQPEKIILFGSLASDEVKEESDIDLLLVKKSDKRPLERVMEVMALLGYPRVALDIFVYTPEEIEYLRKEESQFIEDILEHGKVLYEKNH